MKIRKLQKISTAPKDSSLDKIAVCIGILVCQVNSKSIVERILYISIATDYGHTMAKVLILCGPNSNPNPE